jgi:hypothetical protein
MRLSALSKDRSPLARTLLYTPVMKIFAALIGILAGAFAMVFGEFDDSPGLQGLGMLLIIFIIFRLLRAWREQSKR